MRPTAIVLAAGLGTRMRSGLAKALHPLAGMPLVRHVLATASSLHPARTIVVLGHQADRVRQACAGTGADFVLQREQLGTGHALLQALDAINAATGPVIVLCADAPLLQAATLRELVALQAKTRAAVALLTAVVEDPFGYGRVVRDRLGVRKIVEEKDASAAQRRIAEVNGGMYCFEPRFLASVLGKIGRSNAQAEYYLPDAVALARARKKRVAALICDPDEVLGINSRADLSRAEEVLCRRTTGRWMAEGVTMLDPGSVRIGAEVVLGKDVTLYPQVVLEGRTSVGEGTTIYPGTRIADSVIGSSVVVRDHSVIVESTVSDGASIGPFAHLRPGSLIRERARIGNFVEVKKSVIGEESKANHLSYIGDATIGKGVNIGAGVITCNYDGFEKHRTIVEDGVFVGSDAQLVAPVTVGRNAVVAAGATITKNVPEDALAISRVRQENREGFAAMRRKMKGQRTK